MEKTEIIRELAISMVILLGGFMSVVGFLFVVFRLVFPFQKKMEEKEIAKLRPMMRLNRPRNVTRVRAGKMGFSHG